MKKSYEFSDGKRGAVIPTSRGATRVTIRIDDALRDFIEARDRRLRVEESPRRH